MRRRNFITLLCAAGVAGWPLVARPQDRQRRIGVLLGRSFADAEGKKQAQALEQGLSQLGWNRDRNIQVEYRWAGGDLERTRTLAKELVSQQPDVIVAQNTAIVTALLGETRATPIVFVQVTDPVKSGFVASLARPGGNASGLVDLEPSLAGKWVDLLKQIAPRLARVHCIFNPETAPGGGSYYLRPLEAAATSLGIQSIAVPVRDTAGIEQGIAAVAGEPNGGLVVMPDIFNGIHHELIISTAARDRVPAIYAFRFFASGGGLMSYGIDILDLYRRAAAYVDRVLRGSQIADLPVQLPVKFELVINLKAARALGVDVSSSLLAQADEVIE
ncbi:MULTISPECIES: ABC transporter substrate-binding protein [unclassified Bradyrhizobium]|uniref:ABC transporter substrate-binding protein n=1 Tax=unclassified Bradyrhizobium TaxID=2631580 RepID=UPI00247A117C|nr:MULTISPECIES: ABC transporter substrate-binding protein [unclassified Bradyrhizobium]WGR73301.1 ABC transporter substrate-binding protein [Bradyrhizobium sp. ISRA426]WGR78138.1 ABC transporter substrate-binding protein [Bradyrhizobium sp. ISRA430]WGR88539.1 ABC transporter substrate-binding protein [Bradyrhizobium sp. ISRA432]